MKTKIVNFLGLLLSLAGVVLAYSDKISEIQAISPTVAQYWPFVLGAATFLDRFCKLIGDYLDDGILNSSFGKAGLVFLLASATLFFASCSSTTVYRDGKPVFHTQADASQITYRDDRSYFHAAGLNHSRPTAAGGSAASQVIKSGSSAVTAAGAAFATGGAVR